jgi:hypothetical protein
VSIDTGFKMPAFQRIFILDNDGKEYSCIIGIDYFMKKDRADNNIRLLQRIFHDIGKDHLISDWAEKR